jgi:hypothetical protein
MDKEPSNRSLDAWMIQRTLKSLILLGFSMNKQRVDFVESLLSVDLKKLIDWNRDRDPNAKRKLIQFINLLYTRLPRAFKAEVLQKGHLREIDGFDNICQEAFESGSSTRCSKQMTRSQSLSRWLAGPLTRRKDDETESTVTGSFFTDFSDLSITTYHSSPHICPAYVSDFQLHKRGIPVNRRQWNPTSAHSVRRLTRDSSVDTRGEIVFPFKADLHQSVFEGVFKTEAIGEVCELFKSCSSGEQQLLVDVTRSIRCMGSSLFDTSTKVSLDHARDIQVWNPVRAKPFMSKSELYKSQLPFAACANARRKNDISENFRTPFIDKAVS